MTLPDTAPSMPTWKGRAILLVDLDAFFASVEQLDHPEWRGKPVIVGGDPTKRGVVSTASYEAREFGVHSAMPAITAARLCPQAIWTNGHFKRYREMSDKVMEILLDETPLLEQVSIDEAFCDVTPGRFSDEHPVAIAGRIRNRVAQLGITCSIGIGTSKTVAKIASDRDKPNGITTVFPGSEEAFLAPLPVRTLSGIGARTADKLARLGIATLGELAHADEGVVRSIFGVNTGRVRDRCRGIDPAEVQTQRDVKSVSNEMTFSTDLTERTEIEQAVEMLSARVGRRLRKKGLAGHTAVLKMRYDDLSRRTAQQRLDSATDDEGVFAPVLCTLIDELWQPGVHVRLLGVGISGFDTASRQLGLFDDATGDDEQVSGRREETHRRLIEAVDQVRDRFGDEAVGYGRDLRFRERGTNTTPQNKDEFN
jgi:DNA polymerase-4